MCAFNSSFLVYLLVKHSGKCSVALAIMALPDYYYILKVRNTPRAMKKS
jgi:hypothetical protein